MSRMVFAEEAVPAQVSEEGLAPDDRQGRALQWIAERGIFLFTALLVVFAAIFVDGFASAVNITDVFHRAAPIGIVAVGMTFVVISGNYLDLSVVAQVATAAVVLIGVSNGHGIPLRSSSHSPSRSCTALSTASPWGSSRRTP